MTGPQQPYTQRENKGRRATDSGGRPVQDAAFAAGQDLTFAVAVGRSAVWLLGTMLGVTGCLLVWLCLSVMSLKSDNHTMGALAIERNDAFKEQFKVHQQEIHQLHAMDIKMLERFDNFRVLAAEHGWKEPKNER